MGYSCVGLIGGTGLDDLTLFEGAMVRELETPYGTPSGPFQVGDLPPAGLGRQPGPRVVTIARHGPGQTIPPHKVNHRANLWGLKELGCETVLATSSTGSLRADLMPGSLVVPDDYICAYPGPTFFDDRAEHIIPVLDDGVRKALMAAARKLKEPVTGGIYIQTGGPRFETKAEVRLYAGIGDLVGMTMAHEATLAQELSLPYASLCRVDNLAHGLGTRELDLEDVMKMAGATGVRARKVMLKTATLLQ